MAANVEINKWLLSGAGVLFAAVLAQVFLVLTPAMAENKSTTTSVQSDVKDTKAKVDTIYNWMITGKIDIKRKDD